MIHLPNGPIHITMAKKKFVKSGMTHLTASLARLSLSDDLTTEVLASIVAVSQRLPILPFDKLLCLITWLLLRWYAYINEIRNPNHKNDVKLRISSIYFKIILLPNVFTWMFKTVGTLSESLA